MEKMESNTGIRSVPTCVGSGWDSQVKLKKEIIRDMIFNEKVGDSMNVENQKELRDLAEKRVTEEKKILTVV